MPQDKFSAPWKKMAAKWEKFYTSPSRPSKGAINVYRDFLKNSLKGITSKPRILIMGATPELRDLVTTIKCEVTIIDINLEMILAMTDIMKKKNPNEIMVKSSWLDNPLEHKYYDIVMGDAFLANVPLAKQAELLMTIYNLLKPSGYLINKLYMIPDDWQGEPMDETLARYISKPEKENSWMDFFCYLLADTFDKRKKLVDCYEIKKWMAKFKSNKRGYYHPDKKITRYFNKLWEFWEPMDKKWGAALRSEYLKMTSKYFKLMEERVLSDCHFRDIDRQYPIWYLRKK